MQPAGPSSPRSQLTHGVFNGCISPELGSTTTEKYVIVLSKYLKDYLIQQSGKKYSRSDVGGIASRIEQLVEDRSELRQGFKSLQSMVKADNLMKKIEGRLAVNDVKRYFEIVKGFYTGQTSIVKNENGSLAFC